LRKGKLTPGQNVLWESSRMMLPEHREAFLQRQRDWLVRERPDADEQERGRWAEQLTEAMTYRSVIRVTVWERHRERIWTGRVRAIDVAGTRFQLEVVDDSEDDQIESDRKDDGGSQRRTWLTWDAVIALHTGRQENV
jgi:hypothetical protein